jgi:hypothetical protein
VRLRRNLRLEPSEAPENGTQNQHSLRSATLPRAINRLTQLAASRGGRPLISHLCVPRPLARCQRRYCSKWGHFRPPYTGVRMYRFTIYHIWPLNG